MITNGINAGKRPFYNMASFLCDFQSDVANLPLNRGVGSIARVIENGNVYIFNTQKQWILQPKCGGGTTPPEEDDDVTIIYDGGDVAQADYVETVIYDGGSVT